MPRLLHLFYCYSCILLLLNSCQPQQKPDDLTNEVSDLSAQKIKTETLASIQEMEDILHHEPVNRADKYLPLAKQIHQRSLQTLQSLDSFFTPFSSEKKKFIHEKDAEKIFKLLQQYRQAVISMHHNTGFQLNENYIINKLFFDTSNYTLQNFYEKLFRNASADDYTLEKKNMRNAILLAENEIIVNYLINSKPYPDMDFEMFSTIISQNSNIVKPGDPVIITAGMGAFTNRNNPRFIINGHIVKPENGVAQYAIRSSKMAGHYTIPVSITFIKADGSKDSIAKSVDFTVKE